MLTSTEKKKIWTEFKENLQGWSKRLGNMFSQKQVHPTSSIKQEIKTLKLVLLVYKKTLMGV